MTLHRSRKRESGKESMLQMSRAKQCGEETEVGVVNQEASGTLPRLPLSPIGLTQTSRNLRSIFGHELIICRNSVPPAG